MKKKKNSIFKTMAISLFFVIIIIFYINYINSNKGAKKIPPLGSELEYLTNIDFEKDQPKTPRDVVKLHSRYLKVIYGTKISESEMISLANKMRGLYSLQLLEINSQENNILKLKKDLKEYEKNKAVLKNYTLPESSSIKYYSEDGEDYAAMEVKYIFSIEGKLYYYYQWYVLIEEEETWKIFGWGESSNNYNE